jgi:formylglycine-generating enzyme required for sulfatase activity
MVKHDAFVSHSATDSAIADAVVQSLEAGGIKCWVAPRDILVGEKWAAAIMRGISECRAMVLLFSANAQQSEHVLREIERAVKHRLVIVPVRIDKTAPAGEMEFYLSSCHWLDAWTTPFAQHLPILTEQVRTLLHRDNLPEPPSFKGPKQPSVKPTGERSSRRFRTAHILSIAGVVILATIALSWPHIRAMAEPSVRKPTIPAPTTASASNYSPATSSANFVNLLGMRMINIPAGSFMMGSRGDSAAYPDEISHVVHLTKPFHISATLVTRAQFAAFVADTNYQTDAERSGGDVWTGIQIERVQTASWRSPGFIQTDDHPVVLVSWNDATAFCAWLSRREHLTYRLPTEAEWEYACKAGTTTAYPWGDDPSAGGGWANVADLSGKEAYGWGEGFEFNDGYIFTSPVAHFRPNNWQLYDMIGNVWEWCADGYGDYSSDPNDPIGTPSSPSRVRRGGSWSGGGPRSARSAFRSRRPPTDARCDEGFRVAAGI